MKALVEPLPLVPAMWMMLRGLKSGGWFYGCSALVNEKYLVWDASCRGRLWLHDRSRGATHTSYPALRHHSIISGMAFLFMLRPDLRMASTTAKLDWRVLSAAMAALLARCQ